MNSLAIALDEQNIPSKIAEAGDLYRRSWEMRRRVRPLFEPNRLANLLNLVFFVERHGKPDELIPLYREQIEALRLVCPLPNVCHFLHSIR
jgi:hypothetical protein